MCDGASTAVAGAGLLINTVSALMGHDAEKEAYEANKKAALASAKNSSHLLSLRQMQEQQAAQQSIFQTDMEARRADATNRVMAGESGVSGASVSMLLDDVERQRLEANTTAGRNLDSTVEQLSREKDGVWAEARGRINSTPKPNPWATGLKIFGAGAEAAGTYVRNSKPTAGGK